jgi:hypothetical protein
MSYTLSQLRTALRDVLADTGAAIWPNAALDHAIGEAVAEHSYLFPKRCYLLTSVTAGAQEFALTPGMDPLAGTDVDSEIIAVQGVELPVGTRIPEDPRQSTPPPSGGSCAYRQGYFVRDRLLCLTNPASGTEIGTNTLKVYALRTYNLPNAAGTIPWDGDNKDQPLLLLLAARRAYTLLAGWKAAAQVDQTTVTDPDSHAAINISIPAALAALDREITAAIRLRQQRAVRSRTLDV